MFWHQSAIFWESTNTKDHKKRSLWFVLYSTLLHVFVGYCTEYKKMHGTNNIKNMVKVFTVECTLSIKLQETLISGIYVYMNVFVFI